MIETARFASLLFSQYVRYMHYASSRFSPQDDRYLFIDMNSFFATCEQQLNPAWRGKPLVVAPYTGPTGCCIAVSTEAKKLGIKTGTGVKDAKLLCPNVIVAESRPEEYKKIHNKLVAMLGNFSPWVDVQSIDEMAIPLSPSQRGGERPLIFASQIKQALKKEVGDYLTASIGIGPNIFLAKQASEDKKPDGLTVLRIKDLSDFFARKELTDLTGIAHKMAATLRVLGIRTPLDFYETSPETLRKKLGMPGEYWYLHMHGYPIRHQTDQTKSIGHSCVLPPKARNWVMAENVLRKLVERAGVRMRRRNLMAQGLHLSVRFLGQPSTHIHMRTQAFNDSFIFYKHAQYLWQKIPKNHNPLLLAITAQNLINQPQEQMELFSSHQKNRNIHASLDTVNDRFGSWTLYPASLLKAKDYAPSRIAFGKPH